jgi:hypothetical protein
MAICSILPLPLPRSTLLAPHPSNDDRVRPPSLPHPLQPWRGRAPARSTFPLLFFCLLAASSSYLSVPLCPPPLRPGNMRIWRAVTSSARCRHNFSFFPNSSRNRFSSVPHTHADLGGLLCGSPHSEEWGAWTVSPRGSTQVSRLI